MINMISFPLVIFLLTVVQHNHRRQYKSTNSSIYHLCHYVKNLKETQHLNILLLFIYLFCITKNIIFITFLPPISFKFNLNRGLENQHLFKCENDFSAKHNHSESALNVCSSVVAGLDRFPRMLSRHKELDDLLYCFKSDTGQTLSLLLAKGAANLDTSSNPKMFVLSTVQGPPHRSALFGPPNVSTLFRSRFKKRRFIVIAPASKYLSKNAFIFKFWAPTSSQLTKQTFRHRSSPTLARQTSWHPFKVFTWKPQDKVSRQ